MERIRQLLRGHGRNLLQYPNVIGVGVGRKMRRGERGGEGALVVFVTEKLPPEQLPRRGMVPQSIGDVPTDVIAIGKVRLLAGERTGVARPLQPGVSIGHYRITAGTLGAIVYDNQTQIPLLLSNNHVLANATDGRDGRSRIGDAIYQPGPYDGGTARNQVATLERFIPLQRASQPAQCQIAQQAQQAFNQLLALAVTDYRVQFFKLREASNKVDCALARPLRGVEVNPEIIGIGKPAGLAEAEVGMRVKKSGRTTGLTQGEVLATDSVLQVNLNENETALFEDQVVFSQMSQGGDSGSLIVNEDNAPVALLFAGSDTATIGNRIQNVVEALGVHF